MKQLATANFSSCGGQSVNMIDYVMDEAAAGGPASTLQLSHLSANDHPGMGVGGAEVRAELRDNPLEVVSVLGRGGNSVVYRGEVGRERESGGEGERTGG